ncbi:hypothetical protein TeGR_g6190, partial [Tetraparma gracilis]
MGGALTVAAKTTSQRLRNSKVPTVAALVLQRLQEDNQDDSSWSRLAGTVREPVSYFKKVDEDSNTWGKGEGVVDASAPDVLAWLWHSCTHERNLDHERKDGNLLKMELDVSGTRSKFMVASSKMPGAISNRVFANWWTWAKEQNGDLVAAFTPHEDFGPGAEREIIDAALEAAKRSVLAKGRGFYRIKTLAPNVCRVTMVAQGSLGGSFTKQAMAWAVKSTLSMVKSLQDKYMRNGAKVDAEMRAAFPAPPPRGNLTSEQPKAKESSVAVGKAKATIDCSAAEALASTFASCGREKMKQSRDMNDRARFVFMEHTKHDFEWASVKKMPFPLTKREFLGRYMCFKDSSGDLILAFDALPGSLKVNYGANIKVVRAKTTGVFRFKPINDDTQCEVTLVQHGDAGGFVPERVVVAKIPEALVGVTDMRELFERDDAIDDTMRSELVALINAHSVDLTGRSQRLVKRVTQKFSSLTEAAFEKLESPDHFVHMFSALEEGSSTAIGRATTVVDAPIAEVAAWELAKMSRENQKEHAASGGLERDLVKINNHQNIFHVVYDLSIPKFLPRQGVTMQVWMWAADKKELTVVYDDVKHDEFPERKEYLRMSATIMVKYKQEAEVGGVPQTKVTYTLQVDVGGVIPKWVQNRQGVGKLMFLSKLRKRFDRSLELDVTQMEELVEMIRRHRRDGVEYSKEEEKIMAEGRTWFKAFDGLKSKDVAMRSPQTKGKVAYKRGDSRRWGWSTATVRASPNEVLAFVWGGILLKNAAWGLWFRVISGSGLSMLDLATDINVIRVYFGEEGQEGYGWNMLGMVLASMGLQVLVVLVQNGKMGWGKLLREVLIVVSGLKPGVDAMRVVSNAEMDKHHAMDAKQELAFTKGIEMFCESIPGCVLQVFALIQGGSGGKMRTKVLSIVVSALTTGMASASISYDFDSDPGNRLLLPKFYGYLPDDGNERTVMYVCMVLNSALLLVFRSIGAALLMLADTKIFVAYMAGDHLLYLLQKL